MKQFVYLILLFCAFGFAQNPNYQKFDALLETLADNHKFMGSVTASQNSNMMHSKSVGYAHLNKSHNQKINSQSKFRIGSITKTFTATMIFQLIEEGKISLETHLSEFFPKLPNASKITVDHLLTHSSGLFNLTNAKQFGDWVYKPTTQKEMLSRMLLFDADFEPGEKHEYSNTNYLLLGYIIETLDKSTYGQSLEKRIVNTLNLSNTYYGTKINTANNECLSFVFSVDNWEQAGETDMSLPGGAGAIVSTADELTVFMDALFNYKLINASSLKTMTTYNESGYCKGLFRIVNQGQEVYVHDGGIDGFQSLLVYFPEHKISIALTSNALNYDKRGIVMNAFKTTLGLSFDIPKFKEITLTEAEVKQYEGVYESKELPYDLIFKANGIALTGAPEGDNLKTLTAIEKDEFTFDKIGVHLKFDPKANTLIFTHADNPSVLFTKKQ